MDSFELNKIIGAILLVALLVIGIGKVSNLVFKINKPEKSNYKKIDCRGICSDYIEKYK